MDESKKKLLMDAGVDYDSGVRRFMGKSGIYESVLLNFANDDTLRRALDSYNEGDIDRLMDSVHEIKGASGNMDMFRLYESASAMVALIRGRSFNEDELCSAFEKVKRAYSDVKSAIAEAFAE